MAGSVMNRINIAFRKFELTIQTIFGHGFPPGISPCVIECNSVLNEPKPVNHLGSQSLKEILENGILWAVPKKRRSLEKRLQRKHGIMHYQFKPSLPKKILMCPNCGHNYEPGRLCGHCYEKIKIETKEMQEAIQKELDLSPVEKDVIVLYDGERDAKTEKFWKNQRIVELPKKRPSWFHRSLLEPTTEESTSDKKDIKPTHLV
ncbi:39S ribosomal protein L32, mitochondrial [Pseudomyrmex gracilis]|uniref:39S ribosomal protein L32, mitochondrial n=1 Tax=Pseudomyrmex gracilis TaxID=219809 RepID=UPI00099516E3|nr:39S ribosomal protein L32, mitochondrial [Pseudomyrmex gracilis]